MWIARLLPEGTKRYKSASNTFRAMDRIMDYKPMQWFAPWVMFAAGVGWRKAVSDRFYFWDFSGWEIGVGITVIITIIIAWALKNQEMMPIDNQLNNPRRGFLVYSVLGIFLFLIGWAGNPIVGMKIGLPYYLVLIGTYVMFLIPMEKDGGDAYHITDHKKRIVYSAISLLFSLIAVYIGFLQDEPVISTSAMVYAPFAAVSLIAPHARHVRRARLYSVFIYGFFISMRAPWLLVMMFVHYHGLRFYNYFRHGTVLPTLIIEAKEDMNQT